MNAPFDMKGKVVVLTGGSGFLGRQFSAHLESYGAIVENFDLDTGVNITDEQSVQAAVSQVLQRHNKIDGLISAAAANPKVDDAGPDAGWAPYSEFSTELFRKEVDINLTGSFIVAKAVSKQMIEQRSGSIIFISSHYGVVGPVNSIYEPNKHKSIGYGASKAGVLGLMRFFASYLGQYNVRVNALVPGGMFRNHDDTFAEAYGKLTMLGRMSKSDEYNGAVQFLLSDASSYMTGQSLIVDGGLTSL
jgi:NAD(P)-dependent dehydrogenase (short-subunit alcohol dehydrogenase family)